MAISPWPGCNENRINLQGSPRRLRKRLRDFCRCFSRRRWEAVLLGSLVLAGCRGPEDYLPQPRLADDDEEEVDNAASVATSTPKAISPATSAAVKPAISTATIQPQAETTVANTSATPANATPQLTGSAAPAGVNPALQPAQSTSATIARIQPGNSLTVVDRRRHTISCMRRISIALEQYRTKHNRYPDSYFHYDDQPYLSWRVELLPYLGYEALYKRFNYREPWDSPGNRRLIAEIPPVYQSPERGDEQTNFLLATGKVTAYASSSGPRESAFPDGKGNTILLVEVDEAHAIPWTKPDDWRIDTGKPREGLFSLREDGFFAVFGGGVLRQIPTSINDDQLVAFWTARGGETVDVDGWSRAPAETVDENLAALSRKAETKSDTTRALPGQEKVVPDVNSDVVSRLKSDPATESPTRPEIPTSTELKIAEATIKKVYGERYSKAETLQARRQIASVMLTDAELVRHELPAYYTMLRIARDIATNTGELTVARTAMQRIESAFEFNVVEQRLQWLETANEHVKTSTDAAVIADEATSLFEIALKQDAFDECRDLHGILVSLARRTGDMDRMKSAADLRSRLDTARKEYSKIAAQLHILLRSPDDSRANQDVGKYLCLVKGQWDSGLAHLVKGSDGPLKQAAILELEQPTTCDAQTTVGNIYWSLSEGRDFEPHKDSLRDRAAYWYRQALPQQPDGLQKALIQERLRIIQDAGTE